MRRLQKQVSMSNIFASKKLARQKVLAFDPCYNLYDTSLNFEMRISYTNFQNQHILLVIILLVLL